jgi:hypothetical protein
VPFVATLTRASAPVASSFTKTSATPFESPPTRFPAALSNARKRPSRENAARESAPLSFFPSLPAGPTLARVIGFWAATGAAVSATTGSASARTRRSGAKHGRYGMASPFARGRVGK